MADKILVLFVEPMLYNMDLIREVYQKTPYTYQYVYCTTKLTGKDDITLPEGSVVCQGDAAARKAQIRQVFDRFRPDFAVINGYVGTEQSAAIAWCKRHRVPYAIESDTPLHIPENPVKAFLKKLYLRKQLHNKQCYGFPGGTAQRENLVYYGIPAEKCHIMPMCVSAGRLLRQKDSLPEKAVLKEKHGLAGKKVFLFVGRLVQVKNVQLLLEAFAKVKAQDPDTALMIVGDGALGQQLRSRAKELELEDVVFAGYVVYPELVEYYKLADIFVLPSSYEPWGLVVNEAMILGLPVIASHVVGCCQDLIDGGNNGFVFRDGSAEDLQKCMETILQADLEQMARNAEEKIRSWDERLYKKQFLQAVQIATQK